MTLTPEQCRAARGLLDWTQDELAERARVSRGTVRGFEAGRRALRAGTAAAVRGALEAGGAVFLDPRRGAGPGVRLADVPAPVPAGAGRADAAMAGRRRAAG